MPGEKTYNLVPTFFSVEYHDVQWKFDNEEEFYSEYRKEIQGARYNRTYQMKQFGAATFSIVYGRTSTSIEIGLPSKQDIEKVFEVFEDNYEKFKIPEEDSKKIIQDEVKVFIGHGRNNQWRDLKDHLENKHKFNVIAYETGVRAGYSISEVLEEMSQEASMAFLVHTGEDLGEDGVLHARENVIHETGLFQGILGFKRAIVLLEDGCNEFNNIVGIQQVRFSKNNIKEIFGDVVAIIYREFGASGQG